MGNNENGSEKPGAENTQRNLPDIVNKGEIDASEVLGDIIDIIDSVQDTSLEPSTENTAMATDISIPSLPEPNTLRKILKEKGGDLPAEIQEKLGNVETVVPELNFTELTRSEISQTSDFSKKLETLSYEEKFELMRPYVASAQNYEYLPPRMRTKLKRILKEMSDDPNYVPTEASFKELVPYIMKGSKALFVHNVNLSKDLELKSDPWFREYKNPLDAFLIINNIKKKVYIERGKEIKEQVLPLFEQINEFHSLLVVYLNENNIEFDDFFGKSSSEIKKNIKIIRSIMFDFKAKGRITPKQSSYVVSLINSYGDTVKDHYSFTTDTATQKAIGLLLESEDAMQTIIEKPGIDTAVLHVMEYFDTSIDRRRSKAFRIQTVRSDKLPTEVINLMFAPKDKKPNKNNINEGLCRSLVADYAKTAPAKRAKFIKNKIESVQQNSVMSFKNFEIVISQFFSIVDKHLQ